VSSACLIISCLLKLCDLKCKNLTVTGYNVLKYVYSKATEEHPVCQNKQTIYAMFHKMGDSILMVISLSNLNQGKELNKNTGREQQPPPFRSGVASSAGTIFSSGGQTRRVGGWTRSGKLTLTLLSTNAGMTGV